MIHEPHIVFGVCGIVIVLCIWGLIRELDPETQRRRMFPETKELKKHREEG